MATNPRTGRFIRPPQETTSAYVTLFDDFLGDTLDTGTWDNVDIQATGGTDWAYDATAGNPANSGWASATTGTADNDAQGLYGPLDWMANRATSEDLLVFEARVNLPAITGVGMSAGLTDARTESATPFQFVTTTWTTVPTDAVVWSYDVDATTDLFRGIGVKADTDTAAVSGSLPVADTPVKLRIEVDVAGTAYWYYNDIGIGAKANAVTITVPLCPFVDVSCKAGSAAKSGEVDYILTSCPR